MQSTTYMLMLCSKQHLAFLYGGQSNLRRPKGWAAEKHSIIMHIGIIKKRSHHA